MRRTPMDVLALIAACASVAFSAEPPPRLPRVEPAAARMDAAILNEIDEVVAEGLAQGKMPGCVVLIARQGKTVHLKAYGRKRVAPESEAMAIDTVFDLASLTKPIATATSVMLLAEQGKLSLEDRAARHWPEFASNGKEKITLLQLLTHQGGMIADNSLRDYQDGRENAIGRLAALKPKYAAGEGFEYSDVGFMVLGEVVARVSGQPLDEFAAAHIFQPLGMNDTSYMPGERQRARAAPTEKRNDRWMQGEVHDPRAFALGGVAGHAGLFSTAEDLAVYAQMLHGRGEYAGVRVLQPETVAAMTAPQRVARGLRTAGWDMKTGFSINRGEGMSPSAFGHGGFTGTVMWIDPEKELTVIFLSNRLHPDGNGNVNGLAGKIGTIAVKAIQ